MDISTPSDTIEDIIDETTEEPTSTYKYELVGQSTTIGMPPIDATDYQTTVMNKSMEIIYSTIQINNETFKNSSLEELDKSELLEEAYSTTNKIEIKVIENKTPFQIEIPATKITIEDPLRRLASQRGVLDLLFPPSRVKSFKESFDTLRRLLSYTF